MVSVPPNPPSWYLAQQDSIYTDRAEMFRLVSCSSAYPTEISAECVKLVPATRELDRAKRLGLLAVQTQLHALIWLLFFLQKDAGMLQGPSGIVAGELVAYKRFFFSAQAPTLTTSEHFSTNKMGV